MLNDLDSTAFELGMDSHVSDKKTLHNLEAEQATIGAVLINTDAFYEIQDFLVADDFFVHRHRFIWNSFDNLTRENRPIDLRLVTDELSRIGKLREVGGPAYLTQVINTVENSMNAVEYARMVEHMSARRKLAEAAKKMVMLAYNDGLSSDELASRTEDVIEQGRRATQGTVITAVQAVDVAGDLREYINQNKATAVRSGLPALDKAIGGFPYDESTLIVGDSSIGKSTLFIQIAEQVAISGKRSCIFQYESSELSMVMKRIFSNAKVEVKKLRGGTLDAFDKQKLEANIEAYETLHGSGNLFFDTQARNITQIRRTLRQVQPEFIVIDNLAEMECEKNYQNKTLEMLTNMTALKRATHDFKPATVIIHNITAEESGNLWPGANSNPQKKRTANTPPDINSIAWAKDLKNKTDILIFLIPDYQADLSADIVKLCLWVMKDRSGDRLTLVDLWFNRKLQWVTDYQP